MKNIPIPIRSFLLFVAIFCGLAISGHAQKVVTISKMMDGAAGKLVVNDSITVLDSIYYDAALKAKLEASYPIKNIVTLKLNEYSPVYLKGPFSASAVVKISYIGSDNNPYSIQETLAINYDTATAYNVRNSFTFNGAHSVTVKLLSLTTSNAAFNAALVLENQMRINPSFKLDPVKDTVTGISISTTSTEEVLVKWSASKFADEYDLEWTYVDSTALAKNRYGSPVNPALLFRNNATRVSVTQNSYAIPMIYDNAGTLFVRVRAVSIKGNNNRIETTWNSQDPGKVVSYKFNGHENMLNWQSNTSFAEEGKRKVVVQYYDGIMKNRQTVTKENVDYNTIVAETFYDQQGRPAIQVLPAPSISKIISYSKRFNTGVNGAYDVSKYDTLSSPSVYLSTSAAPMDSSSGASKYYSSINPFSDTVTGRKYTPAASGFPFTETVYTPDNTGRISRQSGVGPDHTINSGHETKYSYGSPTQKELDVLFGTEAGDASHYFKNMVRDANGQYSITYQDMHGRTIATSLAGSGAGNNLLKLPSDISLIVTDTLSGNQVSDGTMTVHKSLVVPLDLDYTFTYAVPVPVLKKKDCNGVDVQYRARLDLEIKITDNEFNQLLPNKKPVVYTVSNVNESTPSDSLKLTFTVPLKAGSYEVVKTLKINEEAMTNYRENVFLKSSVCTSLSKLIDEQRKYQTQNKCVADSFEEVILSDFKRTAMLADVTPPSGQYANWDQRNFLYSIFYGDAEITPVYQNKSIVYKGADNKPSMVFDERKGVYVKPQDLLPQQFVEKFQPSWADALLPFHPEYNKLIKYESFKSSQRWDEKFRNTDTYLEAKAAKFLNPAAGTTGIFVPYYQVTAVDSLVLAVPDTKTMILDRMTTRGKNINIYQVALMTLCDRPNCPDNFNAGVSIFNESLCAGDLNMIWRSFREQYLTVKQEVIDRKLSEVACIRNGKEVSVKMLLDSGKTLHFEPRESITSRKGFPDVNTGNAQSYADSVNRSAAINYAANCETYIPVWKEQLKPYYRNDTLNQLVTELLKVCKAGADADHPFGASTVPTTNTTLTNRSFEDAIRNFNITKNITNLPKTVELAVTVPAPYYAQKGTSDKPIYKKPEPCECEKLSVAKLEYDVAHWSQETFSAYLLRTKKISISQSDIDNLLYACNLTSGCRFIDKVIYMPPVFQCYTPAPCTNCKVMDSLFTQFKTRFGDTSVPVLPTKSNIPWDTIQQKKGDLFANFMNSRLGYSLSYIDYLNFKDSCGPGTYSDTLVQKKNNAINSIQLTYNGSRVLVNVNDVRPTKDSGFLISGITAADKQPFLVKTNSKADVLWSKKFNTGYDATITNAVPLKDGGVILAGHLYMPDPGSGGGMFLRVTPPMGQDSIVVDPITGDSSLVQRPITTEQPSSSSSSLLVNNVYTPLFIKIDKNGNIIWSKIKPNSGSTGMNLRDVIELSNNDIAFVGGYDATTTAIDYLIGVLDSNGNGKWLRDINYGSDIAQHIVEDGTDLVMTGTFYSGSYFQPLISRFNKTTGTLGAYQAFRIGMKTDLNALYVVPGGYKIVLSGFTTDNNIEGKSVVLNLNSNFTFKNGFTLSNPQNKYTYKVGSELQSDGSLLLSQLSDNRLNAGYILKLNDNGTVAWSRRRLIQDSTEVRRLMKGPEGNLIGAGSSYGNPALFIYDITGTQVCDDMADNITSSSLTTFTTSNINLNVSRMDSTTSSLSIIPLNLVATVNRSVCNNGSNNMSLYKGPLLCPQSEPTFKAMPANDFTACSDSSFFMIGAATEIFKARKDSIANDFNRAYTQTALSAQFGERFTATHSLNEYHYTLYYYDQAGNLVKTVPPAGVVIDRSQNWINRVDSARKAKVARVPAHSMITSYRYNTLNQVVSQQSPDGGNSLFWYDRLGRLVVSQNAEQKKGSYYSYTLYDNLGRIVEVGQIKSATAITNTISRDNTKLQQWITAVNTSKTQVTKTVYDIPYSGIDNLILAPRNLRNRVSYSAVYDSLAFAGTPFSATYYSYDIHGNVDTLVQDIRRGTLGTVKTSFKKIVYDYDLISGKVNKVSYQPGYGDAFYHRYTYDAENRLTDVETSKDDIYWEKEAFYRYYKHGPLARSVIGQQQVQGVDYAYTLQGWLKGINSSAKSPTFDMGGDGLPNKYVASDAFGYSLQYYGDKDYRSIGGSTAFSLGTANDPSFKVLYNGNIASMGVNIASINQPLLYNYQYDVLNRLRTMTASTGLNTATNRWTPANISDYAESITYDGNGNILTYNRNGSNTYAGKPLAMDSMKYSYIAGTNKLDKIVDPVPAGNYPTDIDGTQTYEYDAIGNLTRDAKNGVDTVDWTVYGKIKRIRKTDGTIITYAYDAAGNRISKIAKGIETWYVRDASGNMMGIYTKGDPGINNGKLSLTEVSLYGSSRLGILNQYLNVEDDTIPDYHNVPSLGSGLNTTFIRGNKVFELSNHLGNVLATVSDRKRQVSLNNTSIDHYDPVLTSVQDYYPFGSLMPGRSGYAVAGGWVNGTDNVNGYNVPPSLTLSSRSANQPKEYVASGYIDFTDGFTSGNSDDFSAYIADGSYAGGSGGSSVNGGSGGYRYGFNGQEKSDEIKGEGNSYTAQFWEYDPRIGRRWNRDPKPNISYSPYSVFEDNPIWNADLKGDTVSPAPTPLATGTLTYYEDRVKDFQLRHPGHKPPSYYLGYGNVYINKFKKETASKLSDEGKQWLNKALVNLQNSIEDKLKEDRFIENNDKRFTDFTFDSHVPAYEDAGVLKLSVMDKVNILLTPSPQDLLSDRGLKQAVQIAKDQGVFYARNPSFAISQAKELRENLDKITDMVHQYYLDNKKFFDESMKSNPQQWADPEHKIMGVIRSMIFPSFIF